MEVARQCARYYVATLALATVRNLSDRLYKMGCTQCKVEPIEKQDFEAAHRKDVADSLRASVSGWKGKAAINRGEAELEGKEGSIERIVGRCREGMV